MHNKSVPTHFLGEAVNTACHIMNKVYSRSSTSKTPYELWKWKKANVKYFMVFGSKCYILRERKNLTKFDPKSDEGIFLDYSRNSRAYRSYNLRTQTVLESINVMVNNTPREKLNSDEQVHRPSETEKMGVGEHNEN